MNVLEVQRQSTPDLWQVCFLEEAGGSGGSPPPPDPKRQWTLISPRISPPGNAVEWTFT